MSRALGMSHSRMETGFSSSISSQSFASSFRGASNPPNFGVSNSSRVTFGASVNRLPAFGASMNGRPAQFGESFKSNTLRIDPSRFNSSLSRRREEIKKPPTAKPRSSLMTTPNLSMSTSTTTFLSSQSGGGVGGGFGVSTSSDRWRRHQAEAMDTTFVGSFRRSETTGGGLLRRAVDELGRSTTFVMSPHKDSVRPFTASTAAFRTSFNSPKVNLLTSSSGRIRGGVASGDVSAEPQLAHFGSMQTDWVSYQAQTALIKSKQKQRTD